VANGLGLSYSIRNAELWIKKILANGFSVGVHGISYNNFIKIKKEYEIFKRVSRIDSFGIRMHYLRRSNKTLGFQETAGYLFDSSVYELKNPFRVGNMWEFPLHLMDSYLFYDKSSPWRNQSLEQAKQNTADRIENACNNGIRYFTILSHDREFTESFNSSKQWYIWLIGWLKDNGYKFVDYTNAITELKKDYDRLS